MRPPAPIAVNARFLSQETTGVQRYGIGLSRELKARGAAAIFLAPAQIRHRELAAELGAITVGRLGGHPWEQWSLPTWCRRHEKPLLVSFSGLGPIRYEHRIQTIHDLSVLHEPSWFSVRYRRFYSSLLPRSARSARHLLTVSEFSKSEIVRHFDLPRERVSVIHSAPNAAFSPGDPRRETLEALGIRRPYLLAVGSLEPRKNLEMLAAAHQSLSNKAQLIIVGSTHPSFARVERSQRADTIFTGPVGDDQLLDLYRGAELFVFPSLYEGFGLPPLEAMRCGTPVLASNAASVPEICGDAAMYCDPLSEDSIASGIQTFLEDSDLRAEYRARGLRHAAGFGFERSAGELLRLLESLR